MNVYIPFNMIIDTDFGVIRLVELVQNIDPYPDNKLKSFLLNRENVNPIMEYRRIRGFHILESAYDIIMDKHYESVLKLSHFTDLISFVINTYKLGMQNEIHIVIGCDDEVEINYLKSTVDIKYKIEICLNKNIKLKDFDYIFIKYIDDYQVDYLLNEEKLSAKRIYVADYTFNTLYDNESKQKAIEPDIHLKLESEGNVLCLVSLYNKKN